MPDSPSRRGRPVDPAAAAERRRRLCDAAVAVALRDGIAGLTTRAVAEEAGLTAAMVGYEFDSKDGLLLAVLEHIHAGVRDALAHAPLAGARDPATVLEALAGAYWAHVLDTPALQRAQYELTLHALALPGGEAIARAQYRGYVLAVANALEHAAPLPSERLHEVAGTCVALMDGLILQWLATGDTAACARRLALGVRALQHTLHTHEEHLPDDLTP
ncbi:MAG: TetR family transcriptional regulator [Burkholderiales bacterium]|nr:MAG: TetR family transcriptional regulator [Burkholderiales bacterium]